ncbi:MAG: ferrous iron transport protein A, partial [Campylobacterota bacterium]|nr:ferrous iron transport protein A [Campylobacterota bacterium]MEA3374073.1 ferrous iron transport protein A [Campylobacterota bacterium]
MKLLTECSKGSKVVVSKLHASGALKQRLISLGIMKHAEISVL